jgi:protocatechuate 3,4-dioxygenase beta subunit
LTATAGKNVTGVSIQMSPQSIIAGRVLDDENDPLPGAIVSIWLASVPGKRSAVPLISFEQVTNADGVFVIGGLGPG